MRAPVLVLFSLLLGGCVASYGQQPSTPSTPKPATTTPAPSPITREALEQRLAQLKAQYDQFIANANATQGAIQDCQYWLETIKAAEKKQDDKQLPVSEKPKTE